MKLYGNVFLGLLCFPVPRLVIKMIFCRYQTIELPALEAVKQNLDCLNSDLEKDLQKLDMENQVLLRKIKEKEETISR